MAHFPSIQVKPAPGTVSTELLVFVQTEHKKDRGLPKRHEELLKKLEKQQAFQAKEGTAAFLRFGGHKPAENALLIGLGSPAKLSEEKLRVAGAQIYSRLSGEKVESVSIAVDALPRPDQLSTAQVAAAMAEGLLLAAYRFDRYKSKAQEASLREIVFHTQDAELRAELTAELAGVQAAAECTAIARDWSNEPSNEGTPIAFAAQAAKLARSHGLRCRILTEADAKREKMNLFLGVGQGSEREGRIVVLEYRPSSRSHASHLVYVGKGITFDSGGISIKPSARMEEMKHDMSGASTVFGAMLLAARWKVPHRVTAILVLTENMPDGNAIQPGNILRARNGKTVEIINTDAEGRLVLADALDFAQEMKPDAIVDVATLTGAVSIALGKQCCAVLGNNDDLIEQLRRCADDVGERTWQLPLYDEYFEDLKSDSADMKNSGSDSYGGTIRGAIFLKQFVNKNTAWAHMDIAAMAYHMGHLPYCPKRGASGLYVRTLARLAEDFKKR